MCANVNFCVTLPRDAFCCPYNHWYPEKTQETTCVGTALGGAVTGGTHLLYLKVSMISPLFNEVLPDQVPHQPRVPHNVFTKLIRD